MSTYQEKLEATRTYQKIGRDLRAAVEYRKEVEHEMDSRAENDDLVPPSLTRAWREADRKADELHDQFNAQLAKLAELGIGARIAAKLALFA